MKYTLTRILTLALSAALFTAIAVGCGQKNTPANNHSQSSTASVTSDTSAESKQPSSAESKTSDTESKTVPEKSETPSAVTSQEESSTVSDTESKTESSVTSQEESEESSEQESGEESSEPSEESSEESIDVAAVLPGEWSMQKGSNYINLTLYTDGTVIAEISGLMDHPIGQWNADGQQVTITLLDTPTVYRYTNDTLVSVEKPDEVYTRGSIEASLPEASTPDTPAMNPSAFMAMLADEWTYSTENGYSNLRLDADGVAVAEISGMTEALIGSWRVEGNSVIITLAGTDTVYEYMNDMLVSTEDASESFSRGTTIIEPQG